MTPVRTGDEPMSFALFANDPAEFGATAVLLTVAATAGAGIQWAAGQLWKLWDTQRSDRAASQKTITDHLEAEVKRLEAESAACEAKTDRLQARVERAEIKAANAVAHALYLETVLKANKIDFAAWLSPPDDTGPHPAPGGG